MTLGKLVDKPANIIVPVLLFILLTPGLLVTLPNKKSELWIQSLTHAAIFALIYIVLNVVFSAYY
uniref:Uncharacterized protein n=1 Tax=viral metagenome TaxID=1070528 RepID=A0A6C0D790_9ZZZZ